MTNYKVIVEDRNYNKWDFCNANTFDKVELDIQPLENKLFNNDIFQVSKREEITLVHSSIRVGGEIPGVLILKDNKTYGRKKGKLLYKCIPDDMRIPAFLIPYEMKQIGFSKVFINIYVTFSFDYWDEKHPLGILKQVIGPIDVLDNYYEYQLYCKSLNSSIQKFTKDTSKSLKSNFHDAFIDNICLKYPNIEDRSSWNIFTIDGPTTTDYDDAFSIKTLENGNQCLSIYISNVTIWMDVLNLWSSFSQRISTIYLPDRKRPMLPTILSDCLCSLQSGNSRIAFLMDIIISKEYSIIDIKYANAKIKVSKNFIYDEPDLLKNNSYQTLFSVTEELSKKYNYISNIRNSNDVVAYLMILMNYSCAKELLSMKNGIFRSVVVKPSTNTSNLDKLPEDVSKFLRMIHSFSGKYIDIRTTDEPIFFRMFCRYLCL